MLHSAVAINRIRITIVIFCYNHVAVAVAPRQLCDVDVIVMPRCQCNHTYKNFWSSLNMFIVLVSMRARAADSSDVNYYSSAATQQLAIMH
jgi:hypothetical protein